MRSSSLPVRFIIFNSLLNTLPHYEEHSTYSSYFPSSLEASEYVAVLRWSLRVYARQRFRFRCEDIFIQIHADRRVVTLPRDAFTLYGCVKYRAVEYRELNEGCAEWKQRCEASHYARISLLRFQFKQTHLDSSVLHACKSRS